MSTCCGFNNNCQCNECQGVRLDQFGELARASSGTLLVTSTNNLLSVQSIANFLRLSITDSAAATFAADATTESLGDVNDYACTDTTNPRTLTLSSSTLGLGTTSKWYYVTIKDESGGASGSNTITIDTEGAATIDGDPSIVIGSAYGSFVLYTNGSNWFTVI